MVQYENNQITFLKMTRKRKSSTLLISVLLLFFFLVFGVFIYLITRPSELELALKKIPQCSSIDELEGLWMSYPNLHDSSLATPIKNRILQIHADSSQIAKALQFLPQRPKFINLIIIPDLSRRITDTINNPDQVESDKRVLKAIYEGFEKRVKFKGKTKDRLLVDLTDDDQAGGQFRTIADSLVFDLYAAPEYVNRKFFDKKVETFPKYIDSLYKLALIEPLGADFHIYFNRKLQSHLRKSDIFQEYRNIVMIITDGYLESEDSLYTGSRRELSNVCRAWKNGMTLEASIDSAKIWIPPVSESFRETEVYLFEISEQKKGKNCDFDILKTQWKRWFSSMGIKNINEPFFFQREDASSHVINKINEIMSQ